jgi:hypothetical protein
VPADVSCVVHSPQQKAFRIGVLRHRSWQSNRAGMVKTCRCLIVQAFMRTLVVEHVAKAIERLCCARRVAAGGFNTSSFSVRCIRSWRPFCCGLPG